MCSLLLRRYGRTVFKKRKNGRKVCVEEYLHVAKSQLLNAEYCCSCTLTCSLTANKQWKVATNF